MASKNMIDKDRENIVMLRDKGLSRNEIADVVGRSSISVGYVLAIHDAVKNGDLAEAQRWAKVHKTPPTYAWAAQKFGVTENQSDEAPRQEVIEAPTMLKTILNPAEEKSKTKTDPELIEAAVFTAARLMIEKQHDEIEGLGRMLCDKLDRMATIIQSCNVNAMQKSNANADNLLREAQSIKSHVEMIRSQTKKRK